jgi:hypothetical protein
MGAVQKSQTTSQQGMAERLDVGGLADGLVLDLEEIGVV